MTQFSYKAMNPAGTVVRGRMEAVNPIDLEMRLKRMDLDFINGAPVARHAVICISGVPRRELINFCVHLEQLMRSGVPIMDGLMDLRDSQSHSRFREVLAALVESVAAGRTLSQAMREHAKVFNAVFCNLVHAGETAGRLPEVLRHLIETLKWEDELAAQAKRLFMYPAFVGTVTVLVTAFLLAYLVPQMAAFIRSMGQELPLQTRLLISTSEAFHQYWYALVGVPAVTILGVVGAARFSPAARLRVDELKLVAPVAGPVLRKILLSRFAGILAMMYSSGLPIVEALRAAEAVAGNAAMEDSIRRAGRLIGEGQNVTAAFQSQRMFPPLVIRMLRVGENTGALDTALLNVTYFYNRDVKESVDRIQAAVEPVMTLLLGLILGWVMLSVLGPMYDIITRLRV